MLPADRLSDLRTALWKLTTDIIPQTPENLQPALANMVRLLGNHLLDPEESYKIFTEIREIWDIDSLELDPRINILALCTWKMRLYLIFNLAESAFQLFRRVMQVVRTGGPDYEELQFVARPHSAEFPFPLIPDEDIEFLNTVGYAIQEYSDVSIRKLAKLSDLSQQKTLSRLKKFEMVFGYMVAVETLGLNWVRAEIELRSADRLSLLLEKFKPFAYRCELHSPNHEKLFPARFSVEFLYPVDQQKQLKEWGKRNNGQLYQQVGQHIYQNYNALNKGQWYDKETTQPKRGVHQSVLRNVHKQIKLTRDLLRVLESCRQGVRFRSDLVTENREKPAPDYQLRLQFMLKEDWMWKLAGNLFKQGILVPYFFSNLLLWRPEYVVEGDNLKFHTEGIKFLYARQETLKSIEEPDDGVNLTKSRLYVPEVTPELQYQKEFRRVKRIHYSPNEVLTRMSQYSFEGACWKAPNLPTIREFL